MKYVDLGSTNPEMLKLLAQMGRSDTWAEFIARYDPMIVELCRHWGVSQQDQEEIRSIVLMQLIETFSDEQSRVLTSFRGFLFRLITNKIQDFMRKRRRDPIVMFCDPATLDDIDWQGTLPLANLEAIEADIHARLVNLQRVFEAARLRANKPETWKIFRAVSIRGEPIDVVAERFGVSRLTVTKANARVIQFIRDEIRRS